MTTPTHLDQAVILAAAAGDEHVLSVSITVADTFDLQEAELGIKSALGDANYLVSKTVTGTPSAAGEIGSPVASGSNNVYPITFNLQEVDTRAIGTTKRHFAVEVRDDTGGGGTPHTGAAGTIRCGAPEVVV